MPKDDWWKGLAVGAGVAVGIIALIKLLYRAS